MKIKNAFVVACVASASIVAHGQNSAAPSMALRPIEIVSSIPVKMRDGILLRADIYRPLDATAHAVLLVRTPYDKSGEAETCRRAAQRGYLCIAEDVRGRFASEGAWYPFRNESSDGYDTVEWAAKLPGSNGKVVMYGESYLGATSWLAALSLPPHLIAIQPNLTASNFHDGWVYEGGALEQWFAQSWTSILAVDTLRRNADGKIHVKEWGRELPLTRFPILKVDPPADLAPYYFDWLSHPDYDSYWKPWSIEEQYSNLSVAAYHVAGWYDVFLRGTLRNYIGMRLHARTQWARDHQQLVIGPWIHDGPKNGKVGNVDFGSVAVLDEAGTTLDWLDQFFHPENKSDHKRVKIFVMGLNHWRDEDDWPLARARTKRFYLHSHAHANSSSGDGALNSEPSAGEETDTFTYDPQNPVPTHGGNMCCSREGDSVASGIFDQAETEKRADVLVYTTKPFAENFEVTGPISVEIYVSSSAPDTDVTAKLVDVWPNGFAENLADSIQRLRYRESPEKSKLLQPGAIYLATIDLGAISNVFLPGHQLRLEISSSNSPHFDRNLGTAESPEAGSSFVQATNRIYHDAQHPSAILLPVVPAQ